MASAYTRVRALADALALHYGWAPTKTPTHCVCGAVFAIEHLYCPVLWYHCTINYETRDLTHFIV